MAGKAAAPVETEVQPVDPFVAFMDQLDAHLAEHPENKEKLRAHPVVSGIAGNIAERKVQETLAAAQASAAETATAAEIQRQLDLAENDPEAFASQFLTKAQADRQLRELESLKAKERESIHEAIGRATREMFGDEPLTPDELKEIATAIAGKSESETLPAYNKVVVKVLARREARRLADAEIPEKVAAEKEALRTELTGRAVRNTPAPNLRNGSAVSSEEPDYTSDRKAWNKWYESTQLKRR